jgi:hypothetical protein
MATLEQNPGGMTVAGFLSGYESIRHARGNICDKKCYRGLLYSKSVHKTGASYRL